MVLQSKHTARKPMEDEKIIELYFKREEKAIEETDFKYRKYLFSIAFNVVHDRLDCEECLNDTYLAAWNTIPPERPYLLKAYLSAIIRNQSLMVGRKQGRQKRAVHSQAISLSDLEDVLADTRETDNTLLLASVMDAFLSELDKEQRFIFIGRYYYGKQIEDIAKEMGVSRSKVNKKIAYIKQSLKQALETEGLRL